MDKPIDEAAAVVRASRHLLVFTGAGISAESGIPTFRDDEGFWRRFPMEQFGNWRGLLRLAISEPRRLAEYVGSVLTPIADAEPNVAHRAIAESEPFFDRVTVVTQNIDALHQRAGSTVVFEIHGTLFSKCGLRGGWRGDLSRETLLRSSRRLDRVGRAWFPMLSLLRALSPLLGLGWRGVYRPSVVMFGDSLAEPAWSLARRAAEECDCLLQIGTSGVVYPAAWLPDDASRSGAKTIVIDPEPTNGDIEIHGQASEVVPELFFRACGEGRA